MNRLLMGVIIIILFEISHSIYTNYKPTLIEGASNQYDDYDEMQEDPLFLATKNASNIEWLKSQIDYINDLKKQIDDMKNTVDLNSQNIDNIQQEVADDSSDLLNTDSSTTSEDIPQATGLD